jgi:hypothetical protein
MSKVAALSARTILLPGELVLRLTNIPPTTDHGQILRMFANTMAWTLIGVLVVAWAM